jgi:hypothetical protein
MAVAATVLFDTPQREIASTILDCMERSSSTSIVTGFATPSGIEAIGEPLLARPALLKTLIIGAANYRSFEVLDDLISAGVAANNLHIHLGHSATTGWPKKPFAQFHPMLHSKVYYTEFPDSTASAFIGSHNLTHFALEGLNGEASIRLDGMLSEREFELIRNHIATARGQAVQYSPSMKEAYAWWFREFFDGLKSEANLPSDWQSIRTILIFAEDATGQRPKAGEHLYFEIPAGIQQVNALSAEVQLFLFKPLPASPEEALARTSSAIARYKCRIEGAENRQGNREVIANWQIDPLPRPKLTRIPSGILRPTPRSSMQQVRAEFEGASVEAFEYRFDRERLEWDVELSPTEEVRPGREPTIVPRAADGLVSRVASLHERGGREELRKFPSRRDSEKQVQTWSLVRGLTRRSGPAFEKDRVALDLARPESGAFILVSLQRRRRDRLYHGERGGQ